MKHNYPNNLWLHTLQGTRLAKNAMLFFGLLFCMFFSSMNVVGQNPNYTYDAVNSKNLDAFPVTLADATNIQAKLNRLIIAVDTHPNGEQYVLTFGDGIKRVGDAGGLVPFIANKNNFLSNALDFAINSDGKFYVATNESKRRFIRVYSSKGNYLAAETLGDGSYGSLANNFKGPVGLTFDNDDNLYVADHYLGNDDPPKPSSIKIYRKDATGKYKNNLINQFDNISGTLLNFPFRLAVNSQNQLYVSELGQNNVAKVKILQLDSDFNPKQIGVIGGTSDKLGAPGSIIIDKFDNIFIADFGNEINLPQLLNATGDPDEFARVFEIIKKGIQNDVFKINIYNSDNTYRSIISDGIDFPIDLAISKCGTLYANNAIFDGEFKDPICIPFIGCTPPIPDITLDFDLEVYNRSSGYDTEKPVLVNCVSAQTGTLTNGKFILPDYTELASFTDNCDTDLTLTQDPRKDTAITESETITITATDDAGNYTSCAFEVIIEAEDESPVFTNCPTSDISLSNDPGICGAKVGFATPTASDENGDVKVIQTEGPKSGEIFNVGTTTVTFTATDSSQNTAICSFKVTVSDTEKPVKITCPIDQKGTLTNGKFELLDYRGLSKFKDNCDEDLVLTQIPDVGSEITETQIVTITAKDDAENVSDSCTFKVIIEAEDEAPVFTNCPTSNISQTNDSGICGAKVGFATPTASDENGDVKVIQTEGPKSGEIFNVGTTTVTFTATDSSQNTAICSFKVTVSDTEKPVKITCPIDQKGTLTNGKFELLDYRGLSKFKDNCDKDLVLTQTPNVGSEITQTQTITITAKDDAENVSDSCTFKVIIEAEDEAPSYDCNETIVTEFLNENCQFIIKDYTEYVSNFQNFAVSPRVVQSPSVGAPVSGDTQVEFIIYDGNKVLGSCFLQLEIGDIIPPTFECPGDITGSFEISEGYTVPDYSSFLPARDNCDANLTYTQTPQPGSKITVGGDYDIVLSATDNSGNTGTCEFQLKLTEADNFYINCNNRVAVEPVDKCTYLMPDLSKEYLVFPTDAKVTQAIPVGTVLTESQLVRLTATYRTETVTCDIKIDLVDYEYPVISNCPRREEVTLAAGETFIVPDYTAIAQANDNCEVVSFTQDIPKGTPLTSNATVKLTALDAYGNDSYCFIEILITEDNPNFEIFCPGPIIKNNDLGECGAIVTFNPPTVTDNFGVQITAVRTDGLSFTSGSEFPIGTTILSFSATDSAGNMDNCNLTITIADNEKPIKITCPIDQKGTLTNGKFKLLDYRSLAKFEDNCDEDLVLTQTPNVGSEITQTQVITITAKDDAGNISEKCTFQVVIEDEEPTDTIPPTITCPDDIAINTGSGSAACGAVVIFGNPSASDNSGNVDVRLISNLPSGSEFPVGISTVTFEAKDAAGNTSFCSFEISVNDNTPPAVICPKDILVQYTTVKTYEVPDFSLLSSGSDNCSTTLSYSQTPAIGTVVTENTTVKLRVADEQGNSIRCLVEIKFIDNTELQILNCPGAQTFEVDGNCSYLIPDIAATINTNIEGAEVTQNITPGIEAKNSLTLTITAKFEGQEDTCEIQLIAKDSIDPIVTCPGTQNEIYNPENGFALPNYSLLVQTTENCTVAKIEQFPEVGTLIFADTEVTVLVEDLFGNFDTCTFDVVLTADSTGNTRPVAVNNEYSTPKNQPLDVQAPGVLANDIGEGVLTAIIEDQPVNGNISLNSNGSFFYIPLNDFTGEDFFTYIANDGSENSNPATVTITVTPTAVNIVDCKESFTLELDENGAAVLNPDDLFISRPTNLQFSVSQQTFTCSDLGENTVTLSYSNSDITDSCEVTIFVKDELDPVVNIKDISIPLNEFGSVTITPEMLDNGTFDNCENLSFSLSQSTFGCKDLGENTVTFTATDSSGNESVSTATVTITGNCGFNPEPDIEHIFIYPNPTSGPFQFATPSGVTIQRVEAFDFRGRMILFKDFSESDLQYNMDLSGVQNAVYVLKLFTSEGIDILRVIIED